MATAAAPEGASLGTYRRKKIVGTDMTMGGCSKQLTEALHLDPTIFEPGSLQVVVALTYETRHHYDDADEVNTLVLTQGLDPRVVGVLPEGSMRDELMVWLDDLYRKITEAKAAGDGQGTLHSVK